MATVTAALKTKNNSSYLNNHFNNYLISADSFKQDISSDWFEPDYWRSLNAIIGQSSGRNTTHFVHHNNVAMVLRHYYRGGLFGKLIKDHYWFSGIESTRAYRELSLLEKLDALNLPAPKPIAARVQQQGKFYRADILIEKIANAEDVFHRLRRTPLNADVWQSIGKTIRLFHDHNVYHSDLNIHNIMCDTQDQIFLIDFDKCDIKPHDAINSGEPPSGWREKNLQRLMRSLTKEKNKYDEFFWSDNDWQSLMTGYKAATK